MANDFLLNLRRASLTALKADDELTALVPASSIYPQAVPPMPAWPFVKMGAPMPSPLRAGCVDGSETTFSVHGYAKPRTAGGRVVETAEDHAARIGSTIASALDRQRLTLNGGQAARILWVDSRLMMDGDEGDAFHVVVAFQARCLG